MKAGDHVKIVNSHYKSTELSDGQTGKIVTIYPGIAVAIKMDNGYSNPEGCWHFFYDQVEVING